MVLEKDGEHQLNRPCQKWVESRKKRDILHTIKRRKANSIGHILHRNCLIKHIIDGKIERGIDVMGRQDRRRKQLLDDFKETKGYWNLKEYTLARAV
jgi:hypothetical protein